MDRYLKKRKINIIIQVVFFFFLIAADQLTKLLAVNNLKGKEPFILIKDIIEFRYLENSGAAYGVLQNKMILFYMITIIVLIVLFLIWLRISKQLKQYSGLNETAPEQFKPKTFKNFVFLGYLLAALAAGAVGNLIDRINTGYVVDFIYFKFINFPIFNFADICVTVSVILICIFFIFIYKEDKNFRLYFKKNSK